MPDEELEEMEEQNYNPDDDITDGAIEESELDEEVQEAAIEDEAEEIENDDEVDEAEYEESEEEVLDVNSEEDDKVTILSNKTYTTRVGKIFQELGEQFPMFAGFCTSLADFCETYFAWNVNSNDYAYVAGLNDESVLNSAVEATAEIDPDVLKDALGEANAQFNGVDTSVDTSSMTEEELEIYNNSLETADSLTELKDMYASNVIQDPVDTGTALQAFSDVSAIKFEGAYVVGSEEYNEAIGNLDEFNAISTTAYYDALYEMESSGERVLSESEKASIDSLRIVGVSVPYSEYVPGMDITVEPEDPESAKEEHENVIQSGINERQGLQNEDDTENIHISDGQTYAGMDTEEIETQARTDVVSGAFLDSADAMSSEDFSIASSEIDSMIEDMHESMYSATEDESETSANDIAENTYMSWMQYLQAYNDIASERILSYYNDEEDQQQALDGLANTMRNAVSQTYDSMLEDNEALGFLSDEDIEKLDSMTFTGVNVSYSDYEYGMNLKTGEIEDDSNEVSAEDKIYGDAVDSEGNWSEPEEMNNWISEEDESENEEDVLPKSGTNYGDIAEQELKDYDGSQAQTTKDDGLNY